MAPRAPCAVRLGGPAAGRAGSRPDSDPLRREESGVRAYRVYRPVDDPQYVRIDLDFDTSSAAEEFHVKLRQLWESGRAMPALVGSGRGRVVEEVLREEY